MKQILSLALVLALTAALLTGCGCSANVSDHPGGMITEEPTTRPTIMPSPTATHATEPRETTLPAMTDPTDSTGNTGDMGSTGQTGDTGPAGEGSMPTNAARRPRNTAR
jgi:hypothetical protein